MGESWDDSALFEGPSIMISFAAKLVSKWRHERAAPLIG
jgi:hypothetical protein